MNSTQANGPRSAFRTVLVTGANGFVGRSLCRALLEAGRPVRAVVRNADRVRDLPSGVEPFIGALSSGLDERAFEGVDAVIHLAARAHVMRESAADSEVQYHESNVQLTANLVTRAASAGVRRFVFVSSVKVYGEGSEDTIRVGDPLAPADAYARSKVEGEAIVRTRAGTMEWTIVRPCFIYGPGDKGNFPRIVSLARMAARLPLPLAGIRNARSMIYVENFASLLTTCVDHPGAAGSILIAADSETPSTSDLIRRIGQAAGLTARLFRVPVPLLRAAAKVVGRVKDIDRLTTTYVVDSSDARARLQWESPFSLDEGLARSINKGSP